jgi:hypothetical protein
MSFFVSLEETIAAAAAEADHHVPVSRALFSCCCRGIARPVDTSAASAVYHPEEKLEL